MTTPAPESDESIFDAALALVESERTAYLVAACAGNAEQLRRLQNLLRAHGQAGNFLDAPFAKAKIDSVPENSLTAEIHGARIGRYKILQQIGEGGCGVVFMAEQDEPVRRRVALKVIKIGMDTKAVIARFEVERQALALMDHPNITRVFDAGATDKGSPYFVMELVRGIPVTKYCDDHHLETHQRLELFVQICQAIQHAHQKGVIHRDIKPSNILVTVHEGVAVPKIIDFGIAKATHGRLTEHTLFTAFEQFIGTPAYVSPEQAEMSGLDIDTRSDIYSLGVLLYELLAGRTPFDTKALQEGGLDEMRRKIREQDPPKPSTRLSTLDFSEKTTVAKRRQVDPIRLGLMLRGDLDWIVMRCLEKNRARRYETANELAVDIQRYLRNEPVMARPPSTAYLLQKLYHRHRVAFVGFVIMVSSLLLGLTITVKALVRVRVAEKEQIQLRRDAEAAGQKESRLRKIAETGEQQARIAADRREQVAAFMKEIFKDIAVFSAVAGDTTLLSRILDQAVERLDQELPDQPEVKANLLETLGGIAFNIGELPRAEKMFAKALALRGVAQGWDHPDVALSLNYLGLVLTAQGKLDEAENKIRGAIAIQQKNSSGVSQDLARSSSNLGWVLAQQGRLPEAEGLIRSALDQQHKLLGSEHTDVAQSLKRLGLVLVQEGRVTEAESTLQEALDINIRALGHDHLEVASSLNFLAVTLAIQDQDSYKIFRAIRLYREALAIREKLRTAATFQSSEALTTVLTQQGTLAEVEVALREARRYASRLYPDDHWKEAYSRAVSTFILLEERKFVEAEAEARLCYALRQAMHPDDWSTFHAYSMIGLSLAGQGKVLEALPYLDDGYQGMKRREPIMPEGHKIWLSESLTNLIKISSALGRKEDAARYSRELADWLMLHPNLRSIAPSH